MKSWHKLVLVIIVGVLFGAAGFSYFLWQTQRIPAPTPMSTYSVIPTSPPIELTTWTDEAGFSFQYPKELSLNKHDEDQDNYAHLEFTNKDHPGNLIVWAKDTKARDVAAWIKTDKRFANANILDTTLAGKPAKKILTASPAGMLISGTVEDNILFTVESTLVDRDYWTKVHDTIAGSFVLTVPQAALGSDTAGASEAVDEEEIVE